MATLDTRDDPAQAQTPLQLKQIEYRSVTYYVFADCVAVGTTAQGRIRAWYAAPVLEEGIDERGNEYSFTREPEGLIMPLGMTDAVDPTDTRVIDWQPI